MKRVLIACAFQRKSLKRGTMYGTGKRGHTTCFCGLDLERIGAHYDTILLENIFITERKSLRLGFLSVPKLLENSSDNTLRR
jgi:hypothetical protein